MAVFKALPRKKHRRAQRATRFLDTDQRAQSLIHIRCRRPRSTAGLAVSSREGGIWAARLAPSTLIESWTFSQEAGSRTPGSLLRGAVQAICMRSIRRTMRLRADLPRAR